METILPILIPLTFLAFFALERMFPARPLPKVKWWVVKGLLFFFVVAAINAIVPALVAEAVTKVAKPVDLQPLGLAGALVVLVANEVVGYPVHRFLHRVPFVWRWSHQMHHSAERFDVAGAVYFHPIDVVVQVSAPTVLVALLGVTPDAAALAGFVAVAMAFFQHLNVKTPKWLGYVVLRPEQHSLHHQRGVHAYNYGNLAFMDLLFGTFRNPSSFAAEHGFWDGASAKMGAMLVGRDVGEPVVTAEEEEEERASIDAQAA
jgi:sterol desaturase/sphingolipid hydroxylase (fatty acid hydroxylase superfamily)